METIRFLLKNEIVGETILHEFSTDESRDKLALKCNIKEYDNFLFLKQDGSIRFNANDTIYYGKPYGELSGERFKERLKNNYYES